MGRIAFIGSELIFSDTVHQFLQVLTLSHNELPGLVAVAVLTVLAVLAIS